MSTQPIMSTRQNTLQVAAVVSFYMSAALVVNIFRVFPHFTVFTTLILSRWSSCMFLFHSRITLNLNTFLYRNKAVLITSPDLPLLFLLIQLSIAVVLLHAAALISKRVEIPTMDINVAKKLVPVILVNVIGLVFNTLCLRDVEASFFQVCYVVMQFSHFGVYVA